jgi:hypothetical protein
MKHGSYTEVVNAEDTRHIVASKSFPVWVALYLVLYLGIGSAAFHHLEGINYLEGLYLSVITFTTVGYGDLSPKDDLGRVFCCFFIFLALMGIAQLLDILVDYVMEQRKLIEHSQIYKNWFDTDAYGEEEEGEGDLVPHQCTGVTDTAEEDRWELLLSFGSSCISITMVILVGIVFYSKIVDSYDLVEALYLSTMTVTTVGYGDIVPTNDLSRAFTGCYAIFGTVAFGRAVSVFIGTLGEQRDRKKHEKLLTASALDYDTWNKANANGDDTVTRVEFVYMRLLQMDLVDERLREKIEEQFDRMDRDKDGDLTISDIMLAQEQHISRQKSKSSRRGLLRKQRLPSVV